MIFIDAIKEYLVQTVLKQDLNDLRECIYHLPPNDEEDLQATITLLSACSRNDYTTITDSITKQFKLPPNALPSFYQMIKHRPNFLEHLLDFDKMEDEPESEEEADINQPY